MHDSPAEPITKSQFKLGLSCFQKLRHARDHLPQASQENDMLRLLSEGGAALEALVRATEPGMLVGGFGQDAVSRSRECVVGAMKAAGEGGFTSIYEVTIEHGGFLARIDLLRVGPQGMELVEIKAKSVDVVDGQVPSSTFLTNKRGVRSGWIPYVQDLAFQHELLSRWIAALVDRGTMRDVVRISPKLLLLRKDGIATESTHMNRKNYLPSYDEANQGIRARVEFRGRQSDRGLLVEVDMDQVVASIRSDAQSEVAELAGHGLTDCMSAMRQAVVEAKWPDAQAALSKDCKKCEFRVREGLESGFARCWGPEVYGVEHHILSLGYLKDEQFREALNRAREVGSATVASVLDVAGVRIEARQRMQRQSLELGTSIVGSKFASDPLESLGVSAVRGPIYFLDFETSSYAIPGRPGGRPYEQIPFQFEGHMLPAPRAGLVTRVRLPGFLDLVSADPRRGFVDALRCQLGTEGPVFHWANFERTVLRVVREWMQTSPTPGDESRVAFIDSLVGVENHGGGRLVDMLQIAQESFYHPAMEGSYSIKKVVPVAWSVPDIRAKFEAGHGAAGDPDCYSGKEDPYDGLPEPPRPILEAVGGIEVARDLARSGEEGGQATAIRNGGMAMLAYHYVRMFGGEADPAILEQFRQYCRLDSAAMVMVYALMRDHVPSWGVI